MNIFKKPIIVYEINITIIHYISHNKLLNL